jgi:glycosyltransferase involved in cell wall biosynthesis
VARAVERPIPEPIVSVVIPVRDRATGVRAVLDCLSRQTLPRDRFEVLIGDDGSAPGSLAGIETHEATVRVVPGPRCTSYAARNRAAAEARGAVLAFTDSDCAPDPGWLEEGLAALVAADVAAGEVIFYSRGRPTSWSRLTADMYLDQEHNVPLGRGVTANLLVKREVFTRLGGFDESLPSGGDYDFVRRAVASGACLAYAREAVVRHPTIDDRRAFFRKVRRVNGTSTVRRVKTGEGLGSGFFLNFIPLFGVMHARRNALRPRWRLQRRRLEAAGLGPTPLEELRALAVLYGVVGYVAQWARLRGWREGRRLARQLGTVKGVMPLRASAEEGGETRVRRGVPPPGLARDAGTTRGDGSDVDDLRVRAGQEPRNAAEGRGRVAD